jgi:S-adenosylmethionine decarboxylase
LGNHVLVSLYGIPFLVLDDLESMKRAFDGACEAMGATVLHRFSHKFEPQGVTILYALAESHISAHSFPELGSITLDCYTCGEMNPQIGMEVLIQHFQPEKTYLEVVSRDKEKETR